MNGEVLYEDETTQIDADGITIKRYYFPLGRPKRVGYDEIVGVDVRAAGFTTTWRLWGSNNFTNWMPLDNRRPGKEQLVEIDLGKRVKPTITPDDAERVVSLVRQRI